MWLYLLTSGLARAASPADTLPEPRPEACVPFYADLGGEPEGLSYDQVRLALNGVIQTALQCPRPAGAKAYGMTFELTVSCDGTVATVKVVNSGGAPADYTDCVSAVIGKADFPAHDVEAGFPVTYPVQVSW